MKPILTMVLVFLTINLFAQRVHESSEGIHFNIIDSKSYDSKDGAIIPDITKGYRPFAYLWNGPNNFTSTDSILKNVGQGTYFLKIEDALCGKFSDTLVIRSKGDVEGLQPQFILNTIGPNPFNEEIKIGIESESDQRINVSLFHNSGNMAFEKSFVVDKGAQVIIINELKIIQGIYVLQLCNDNNCRVTQRLIKIE